MITARLPPFLRPVIGATGRPLSFKQYENGTVLIGGGYRGRADPDTNRTDLDFRALALSAQTVWDLFPGDARRGDRARLGRHRGVHGGRNPRYRAKFDIAGLFHAFGFSAHGFQLGPIVGAIIAELVATGTTNLPIAPFDIRRFSRLLQADPPPMLLAARRDREHPAARRDRLRHPSGAARHAGPVAVFRRILARARADARAGAGQLRPRRLPAQCAAINGRPDWRRRQGPPGSDLDAAARPGARCVRHALRHLQRAARRAGGVQRGPVGGVLPRHQRLARRRMAAMRDPRLRASIVVPVHSPELAAQEIERCAEDHALRAGAAAGDERAAARAAAELADLSRRRAAGPADRHPRRIELSPSADLDRLAVLSTWRTTSRSRRASPAR